MATQKPQLPLQTWANITKNMDPSDPEYAEIIERPDQTKIDEGWVYGEKPSHKYFNWGWKGIDEFIHHVNEMGLPSWDNQTSYEIGSLVLQNPYIYTAVNANQNSKPFDGSPDWEIVGQFLSNMTDVDTSAATDKSINYVLQYNNTTSKWEAVDILNIANIKLEDLKDVNIEDDDATNPLVNGNALVFNKDNTAWEHLSLAEAVQMDDATSWTSVIDVQDKIPRENDIAYFDGNTWKFGENVIQSSNWEKILNVPNEFQPPLASKDVIGGARIERRGVSLFIFTVPQQKPGAPSDIGTINGKSTNVRVYWANPVDGDMPYSFNLYRDGVAHQTGILNNYFTDIDVEANRDYVYFVRGVNQHGESADSAIAIGNTFVEPDSPKALDYYIRGDEVELVWQPGTVDAGVITYKVYRDNVEIAETNSETYTDVNVPVGSHYYQVSAMNKYYESPKSNTVQVLIV